MSTPLKATPELAPTSMTPGHTIGPFFHDALRWARTGAADPVVADGVHIEGTVEDGSGQRLPAWLIEVWAPHAVAAERAAGIEAPGFRRYLDDDNGTFSFHVPRPASGTPAAFITLFGLGLTRHFHTAVFLDDASAGEASEVLDAVPAERRSTLIAQSIGANRYRWTIRTQGERETVFFEFR